MPKSYSSFRRYQEAVARGDHEAKVDPMAFIGECFSFFCDRAISLRSPLCQNIPSDPSQHGYLGRIGEHFLSATRVARVPIRTLFHILPSFTSSGIRPQW